MHCDLKPSNLLLDTAGGIHVTDFGLAIRPAEDHTSAALLAGTPAFMAPEQVDPCWGPIGPRTDVFGLGAVLYFLLLGTPPHAGSDVAEVLAQVVSGRPVPFPAESREHIPAETLHACRRSLAKQPGDRFATAVDLAEALSPAA